MFIFAAVSARPQLHVIKQVISDAAMSFIQDGPDVSNDLNVVQHMNPTCRAAHMGKVKELAAAAILRNINDADLEKCQQFKWFTLNILIFYIVLFTAILGIVSELFLDQIMDVVLMMTWTGFLYLDAVLYQISVFIIIAVYGVGGGLLFYYFTIFAPMVNRAAKFLLVNKRTKGYVQAKAARLRETQSQNWFSYLTNKITHELSMLHFKLSSGASQMQQIELLKADDHWSLMNFSAVLQAVNEKEVILEEVNMNSTARHIRLVTVEKAKTRKLAKRLTRRLSFDAFATNNTELEDIPPAILAMRPTGVRLTSKQEDGFHMEDRKRFEKFFQIGGVPNLSREISEDNHIIYSNRTLPDLPTHITCDVTTNPQKAVRRMALKLYDNNITGGSLSMDRRQPVTYTLELGSDEGDSLVYTISEIENVLMWVWEVYWPGNTALNTVERTEVSERFGVWIESDGQQNDLGDKLENYGGSNTGFRPGSRSHAGSRGDSRINNRFQTNGIPFGLFKEWFLRMDSFIKELETRQQTIDDSIFVQDYKYSNDSLSSIIDPDTAIESDIDKREMLPISKVGLTLSQYAMNVFEADKEESKRTTANDFIIATNCSANSKGASESINLKPISVNTGIGGSQDMWVVDGVEDEEIASILQPLSSPMSFGSSDKDYGELWNVDGDLSSNASSPMNMLHFPVKHRRAKRLKPMVVRKQTMKRITKILKDRKRLMSIGTGSNDDEGLEAIIGTPIDDNSVTNFVEDFEYHDNDGGGAGAEVDAEEKSVV